MSRQLQGSCSGVGVYFCVIYFDVFLYLCCSSIFCFWISGSLERPLVIPSFCYYLMGSTRNESLFCSKIPCCNCLYLLWAPSPKQKFHEIVVEKRQFKYVLVVCFLLMRFKFIITWNLVYLILDVNRLLEQGRKTRE